MGFVQSVKLSLARGHDLMPTKLMLMITFLPRYTNLQLNVEVAQTGT